MKTLFVTHKGFHEVASETEVFQDIIKFENEKDLTTASLFWELRHRYSTFRRNKTITIIDIKSL